MYILNSGKPAFLNLLRNLTPQILFLGTSIICAHKAIECGIRPELYYSVASFSFLIWLFALVANVTDFYDALAIELKKRDQKLAKDPAHWGDSQFKRMLKKEPLLVLEVVLTILIVYGITVVVVFVATSQAVATSLAKCQ